MTHRVPAALRLRAGESGGWLYDCHAARFCRVEHGACAASGFAPLFQSQLFGVRLREWSATLADVSAQLAGLDTAARRDHTSEATVRHATWACARTLERLGYDASVPRVAAREQLRFARRWMVARAMFSASRLRRTLSTRLLPPLE